MKSLWNLIMGLVIRSRLPLAPKIWAFNHLKGEVKEPFELIEAEQLGEFANFFKEGK